jgi:hypothetical protein
VLNKMVNGERRTRGRVGLRRQDRDRTAARSAFGVRRRRWLSRKVAGWRLSVVRGRNGSNRGYSIEISRLPPPASPSLPSNRLLSLPARHRQRQLATDNRWAPTASRKRTGKVPRREPGRSLAAKFDSCWETGNGVPSPVPSLYEKISFFPEDWKSGKRLGLRDFPGKLTDTVTTYPISEYLL